MMHPYSLACRWHGHLIKEPMIRTPKKRIGGDPEFVISQECKRCGYVRENKVTGSQPCYIDNDRLQEGFKIWRSLKIQKMPTAN